MICNLHGIPMQQRYRNGMKWGWRCLECNRDECRDRRIQNGGKPHRGEDMKTIRLRSWLKSMYGLTLEDYEELVKKQKGRCAICRSIPDGRRLDVDHCHKTGRIRGLLCNSCNRGLAWFNDRPVLLQKAAAYLKNDGR